MTVPPQPDPGPQRPAPTTPPRAPASSRRTTSIDITRPHGLTGPVVAVLAGQDLATGAAGRATVVERISVAVPIDAADGTVAGFQGAGATGLAGLVGAGLRSGFGRRLAAALPGEAEARTLRYSLLEDLPGAFLVSGYALLRAGLLAGDPRRSRARAGAQADVCVGWAVGGPLHAALADHGHTAVPWGPPAPVPEREEPAGWHPLAPLGAGTVRRRRRLDVAGDGGGGLAVQAHFRDSYSGDDLEMVMHEYAVEATVDRHGRIGGIEVDPRVLPWAACPGAVASAARVVGVALRDLGRAVRRDLVGPATCTHLSSTIRSLLDVVALAPPSAGGRTRVSAPR